LWPCVQIQRAPIGSGNCTRPGKQVLSVTDTGVGIAPENHEAVFEEFRQVGTADKKASDLSTEPGGYRLDLHIHAPDPL
jgi:signal transduction histidine kinase